MKQMFFLTLGFLHAIGTLTPAQAEQRIVKHYRVAEKAEALETSPYILTVSSHNLSKFPHSVVTFTLKTESSRAPAALMPGAVAPPRLKGKRHYSMIEENEFGRDGNSQVIFDRKKGTVYLGFMGVDGKQFFYKQLVTSP